jgi:hypothetical protein
LPSCHPGAGKGDRPSAVATSTGTAGLGEIVERFGEIDRAALT